MAAPGAVDREEEIQAPVVGSAVMSHTVALGLALNIINQVKATTTPELFAQLMIMNGGQPQ